MKRMIRFREWRRVKAVVVAVVVVVVANDRMALRLVQGAAFPLALGEVREVGALPSGSMLGGRTARLGLVVIRDRPRGLLHRREITGKTGMTGGIEPTTMDGMIMIDERSRRRRIDIASGIGNDLRTGATGTAGLADRDGMIETNNNTCGAGGVEAGGIRSGTLKPSGGGKDTVVAPWRTGRSMMAGRAMKREGTAGEAKEMLVIVAGKIVRAVVVAEATISDIMVDTESDDVLCISGHATTSYLNVFRRRRATRWLGTRSCSLAMLFVGGERV
jgi:hypothetical protein